MHLDYPMMVPHTFSIIVYISIHPMYPPNVKVRLRPMYPMYSSPNVIRQTSKHPPTQCHIIQEALCLTQCNTTNKQAPTQCHIIKEALCLTQCITTNKQAPTQCHIIKEALCRNCQIYCLNYVCTNEWCVLHVVAETYALNIRTPFFVGSVVSCGMWGLKHMIDPEYMGKAIP
jgi:hypothetical protein